MRAIWLALQLVVCGAASSPAEAQAIGPSLSQAPPPPIVDCGPNPFLVFFEWNKDEISEITRRILDNALDQYRIPDCGWVRVVVAGHADRSGSSTHNLALSWRRAAAVAAYLASHGIPSGEIGTRAFGESRPLVVTDDDVREPQNRRVEISFGPAFDR